MGSKQPSTPGVTDVEVFLWPTTDQIGGNRWHVFFGVTYASIKFMHYKIALGWGRAAGLIAFCDLNRDRTQTVRGGGCHVSHGDDAHAVLLELIAVVRVDEDIPERAFGGFVLLPRCLDRVPAASGDRNGASIATARDGGPSANGAAAGAADPASAGAAAGDGAASVAQAADPVATTDARELGDAFVAGALRCLPTRDVDYGRTGIYLKLRDFVGDGYSLGAAGGRKFPDELVVHRDTWFTDVRKFIDQAVEGGGGITVAGALYRTAVLQQSLALDIHAFAGPKKQPVPTELVISNIIVAIAWAIRPRDAPLPCCAQLAACFPQPSDDNPDAFPVWPLPMRCQNAIFESFIDSPGRRQHLSSVLQELLELQEEANQQRERLLQSSRGARHVLESPFLPISEVLLALEKYAVPFNPAIRRLAHRQL